MLSAASDGLDAPAFQSSTVLKISLFAPNLNSQPPPFPRDFSFSEAVRTLSKRQHLRGCGRTRMHHSLHCKSRWSEPLKSSTPDVSRKVNSKLLRYLLVVAHRCLAVE